MALVHGHSATREHPPGPALGFMVLGWQLVPAWCHPTGVPGEGAEAEGCIRGNGGGGWLGISQDSAASDSSSLRQQGNFLGHGTEH